MSTNESTALVTGGNRGIGLEVVRQLVALGHNVVLGSRDLARGQAAFAEAQFPEERVLVVHLDVARTDHLAVPR